MRDRNPYLVDLVLLVIAICVSLGWCIYGIVSSDLLLAVLHLAVISASCILLGWCICKFNDYRELLKTKKMIEDGLMRFAELMKMKENEPFKEFENNGK